MKPQTLLPTLPSLPALGGSQADRLALLAGLSFIEGATSGWGARDLIEWFTSYSGVMGNKAPPTSVKDGVVGTIALVPGTRPAGDKIARLDDLPKLLAMSRWRVVVTLRGLLSQPCDDRFLQAAIFAERVRRDRSAWVAAPRDTDLLSDVVLSLFTVDILTERGFHEQNLCVCEVCGRISYNPAVTTRAGCADHPPRTEAISGFRARDPHVISPPSSKRVGPASGPNPPISDRPSPEGPASGPKSRAPGTSRSRR